MLGQCVRAIIYADNLQVEGFHCIGDILLRTMILRILCNKRDISGPMTMKTKVSEETS